MPRLPRFIPDFERGRAAEPVTKKAAPTKFDEMPRDKFTSLVNNFAQTNSDKATAAVSNADAHSFQVVNPWFKFTDKNLSLVNHWLKTKGLYDHSTFPDFQAAADALAADGLLEDVDQVEYVKHLDGNGPRTFKSTLTGKTYDSAHELIANNRHAALTTVPAKTKEEEDWEAMPTEEALARLRQLDREVTLKNNAPQTQINADAFLTLRPEIVDSKQNARLINMQLKTNGITDGDVSIEEFERATNQLIDSGLITLNKNAVAKQRAAEVEQLAEQHKANQFSEEELYAMPMEELRRLANR